MAIVLSSQKGSALSPTEMDNNLIDLDTRIKTNATDIANSFSGNYNHLTNKPIIPDLTGYWTTNEIKNYIGTLPIYDDAQLKTIVQTNIAEYHSINDIDLTNYAKLTDVFSGSYEDLINKPTIPDLTGYATTTWVLDQLISFSSGGNEVDLSAYYTAAQTDARISSSIAAIPQVNLTNYATKDYVTNAVAEINLSGYYTATQTNNAITSALYGYATNSYVNNQITSALSGYSVDLSSYYTAIQTNNAITSALNGYATQAYVQSLTNNINSQLSSYATTSYVNSQLSNYASTSYVSSQLSNYATQTWVSSQITSALTNGTVDLSNYYTKSETQALIDAAGPSISSIDELTDVSTSGAVAGQVLTFNGNTWVAGSVDTGSGTGLSTNTVMTSSTNTTTIDSFLSSVYRSTEYLATVSSSTGYYTTRILLIHDDTAATITEYANAGTNVGSFSVVLEAGTVKLQFTPTNAITEIKYQRSVIANSGIFNTTPGMVWPTDLQIETVTTIDLTNGTGLVDLQTGENTAAV